MHLLHGFDEPAFYRKGYVAIGNFDGVHRGHQTMIGLLVRLARDHGVPAVVFTFDPHPTAILCPDKNPPSLCTVEHKAELLGNIGVDCVIAYPTDRDMLDLTAEAFFAQIVLNEFQATGLVEGPNFCFGRDRAGDISTLKQLCDDADLTLDVVEPVKCGEQMVSSSIIRSRIADGRVSEAIEPLGRPYRLRGTVARGAHRGQSLGFPTANVENIQTLIPAEGVYAGMAAVDQRFFPAAINIGPNPTFNDLRQKLEVHLIGFSGDLYDRPLDVDFLDRIRGTTRFANVDKLRKQLARDVETARAIAQKAGCTEP